MKYNHLSIEEREFIQTKMWEKESARSIAKALKRSPASISREINRNIPLHRSYRPRLAHERALAKRTNRGRKLRLKHGFIRRYVHDKLKVGYSPEQIAGRLSIDHPGFSISHEAIYQYIYSNVYRGGHGQVKPGYVDLRPYLKRRHKRRVHKGMRKGQRLWRPKGNSIDLRPEIINTRGRIGDWESDTVESKNHRPGINTLVERKTGLVLITKLKARTARTTLDAIRKRMNALPPKVRRSITFDNGSENQYWKELEEVTGAKTYFAHPYSSWERGTNENTNGLGRWYWPKGTNFETIPDEEISRVEYALNTRPRKRLGWKTPLEVFNESVALQC